MPTLKLEGRPQPKQEEFFLSTARHIAYGGSRGGGKSWAMRRKFVLLALRYPKLKILLLRRTMPELRNNHIRPLLAELDGFANYKDSEKTFFFPNGSFIQLGYCDHEKDVYQYQGQEYDVIGFEEATQFTEFIKDFIVTSNRTTRRDFTPRVYYTSNPGGCGHQWFKRLFIDRIYQNSEKAEDYVFIPAKIYDNLALMEADPGYVDKLKNLPDDLRKAFLDGDWEIFAGQFFSEFRKEKHVIAPFTIPDHWRKWRSIDWGFKDHTCVLWYASDEDGRTYVYRELYINQTLGTEVSKMVKDLSLGEEIKYTVAGHDMWQKRGTDFNEGESIAETFSNNGVYVEKADISRLVGWNRVREYLADASDSIPHVQIFETCKNLVRTIPLMIYDDRKTEDMSDGTEDHAVDSFRYGLMSRPLKSKPIEEEKPFILRHKHKAIDRMKKTMKRVL
jgi:phage terminase large subunit